MGHYWGRLDYEEALRQLAAAQELRPNDADLVFAVAAVRRRQGKWDAAAASFTRAVELDPVSSIAHFNLGETYFLLHDYGRARQGIDKALELAPDWPQPYVFKAQALLGAGATRQELDRVLQAGVERVGLPAMAETFNGTWPSGNLAANAVFLLTGNPEYRRPLEQLALRASGDSAAYYQLKAHLYRQERREELARAYLDSVRALLEAKAAERPEESSYHARLGLVYAYLGRKADAIREGELAVSQLPVSREAVSRGQPPRGAGPDRRPHRPVGCRGEKARAAAGDPLFRVEAPAAPRSGMGTAAETSAVPTTGGGSAVSVSCSGRSQRGPRGRRFRPSCPGPKVSQASVPASLPQTLAGCYVLEQELGRGGMDSRVVDRASAAGVSVTTFTSLASGLPVDVAAGRSKWARGNPRSNSLTDSHTPR